MSRIPFIEARFFDPDETRIHIEHRLLNHQRKLREARLMSLKSNPDVGGADLDLLIGEQTTRAITRRAKSLLERREAASGLSHLKREDRERLGALREGVTLVAITSEHRADELAASLHVEMPWMAPATEIVWHAMRRSVREGWPGLRLPPLLLDGPPGIGKSHWARRLGALLSAPVTVIEATGESASFGVVGSQRGWGSAHPGRPIETVLQTLIGNPVIVVDEIEKAGPVTSTKGTAYGLTEGLLPLLEPLSACHWSCPYYQVKFDMSWVGWIMTSNDFSRLPAPLLSRCPPLRLQALTLAELIGFAQQQGAARALSETALTTLVEVLEAAPLRPHQLSLRTVIRLLDRAADLQNAPARH